MTDMQDSAVLYIGSRTNMDGIDIATCNHFWPQRSIIANGHITNHQRCFINIGSGGNGRCSVFEYPDGHKQLLKIVQYSQ